MKLRLPSLLTSSLLACVAASPSVYADTFLAEGVKLNADSTLNVTDSERFYDGGKGRDWDNFERTAYNIYTANGDDLSVFGDLASFITKPSYGMYLDCSALYNDSGHCWAYTSSNMLQYWQTYYGVFANKAGTENRKELVHGYNYDEQYVSQLGGTQSLKLNKLFYDSLKGMLAAAPIKPSAGISRVKTAGVAS